MGRRRSFLAASAAVAVLAAGFVASAVTVGGAGAGGLPTGPTPTGATTAPVPLKPAPSYAPAVSLPGGAALDSVAAGDVNGDGKLDLVTGNGSFFTAGSTSLLLGQGGASFAAPATVALTNDADAVLVADVNGDGRPDIVANGGCASSVLTGAGDGTFSAPRVSTLAAGCVSGAFGGLGDVNGDGKPDLVIVEGQPGGTCVSGPSCDVTYAVVPQLGNGDGTFHDGQALGAGVAPGSAAIVGDVDGDGHVDLAAADLGGQDVQIDRGNGDGTFTAGSLVATAAGPGQIAAADLNGDRAIDLVVATGTGVSVLLGNGSGAFATHVDYATATKPSSIAIADVNGDGRWDIVTAGGTDNGSVSVLTGNGDGTFATSVDYPVGPAPTSLAIGDLDGDGAPDIAVADTGNDTVSLLLTTASGTTTTTTTTTTTVGTTTTAETTTSDFTTTGTGSPSAGVTAQVLPALTVSLDRASLDFGALLPGATTSRSLTPAVTSNDTSGYQLAVSRTAFTPADLPLSIACATCGLAATAVPTGAALLTVAGAAGPSADNGDDWPSSLTLGPIPGAARSGSYSSTITFTVVGL